MNLSQIERLLDPTPLALEVGYERLDDGVLHIACRTDMHRCTGAMLQWWFGSRPLTREYLWWHPLDHVSSAWAGGAAGTPIGAVHLVEERFSHAPAEKLSIQFRDPAEIFPATALSAARTAGTLSALLCAHGGAGHDAQRTPDGKIIGSRLIHLGRDTQWGLVLRTHFFLGQDLPSIGMPPPALASLFPDIIGPNLLQHCYDEFTFLSRFLPSIYAAENRDTIVVERPW